MCAEWIKKITRVLLTGTIGRLIGGGVYFLEDTTYWSPINSSSAILNVLLLAVLPSSQVPPKMYK